MSDFPSRLKQLRKDHNHTQRELANHLNVSQNAIFNWENGKREPSMEMVKKIAEIYAVTPDYLYGFDSIVEAFKQRDLELNFDNKERHYLLIHYYNQLERAGRDALLDILSNLRVLNEEGQKEASKRVCELTEITKYTTNRSTAPICMTYNPSDNSTM